MQAIQVEGQPALKVKAGSFFALTLACIKIGLVKIFPTKCLVE